VGGDPAAGSTDPIKKLLRYWRPNVSSISSADAYMRPISSSACVGSRARSMAFLRNPIPFLLPRVL